MAEVVKLHSDGGQKTQDSSSGQCGWHCLVSLGRATWYELHENNLLGNQMAPCGTCQPESQCWSPLVGVEQGEGMGGWGSCFGLKGAYSWFVLLGAIPWAIPHFPPKTLDGTGLRLCK